MAKHNNWGPVERSYIAGTPHRKCQVEGCNVITLDLDDDDDYWPDEGHGDEDAR